MAGAQGLVEGGAPALHDHKQGHRHGEERFLDAQAQRDVERFPEGHALLSRGDVLLSGAPH